MKLYFIMWRVLDIHDRHFVIINAENEKDRDKKFEEWRKQNPDLAPGAFSPRCVEFKDCIYLNKVE